MIEVLAAGPLALVEDLGRTGYAGWGVARAGAFDPAALVLANRLVGNPDTAAGIEIMLGGLALRTDTAVTVALTGTPCPGIDHGVAVTVAAGAVVRLGRPVRRLRSWLAVRGGITAGVELGSRSTDTLGRLGPAPLRAGDVLTTGAAPGDPVSGSSIPSAEPGDVLRVLPGPRADWVSGGLAALVAAEWRVRPESDRVGIRLDGPPLRRARAGELPSEPTLPGAVQIPPDGRPVIFGPDAPTTGGYPVVAVLREADLAVAAQLRPGDAVRFAAGAPVR